MFFQIIDGVFGGGTPNVGVVSERRNAGPT